MADPRFTVHIGGMATGKSSNLLDFREECLRTGRAVEALTGLSQPHIRSRDGRQIAAARVCSWSGVADVLMATCMGNGGRGAVIVDEVSLFEFGPHHEHLIRIHDILRTYDALLWVAGLVATTEFEPFPSTLAALAFATHIVHHSSGRCSVCDDPSTHAVCTVLKQGPVLEGPQFYEPRCLRHLADNPNLP